MYYVVQWTLDLDKKAVVLFVAIFLTAVWPLASHNLSEPQL